MNNSITIVIPGKPKGKQRARKGGRHWYNPQKEKMQVDKRLIESQLPEGFVMIPKKTPVLVDVFFFFEPAKAQKTKKFIALIKNENYPYLKKIDRDNGDKYALDCMSKLVFYDDNQVFGGSIFKYYSLNPRTEIEIKW